MAETTTYPLAFSEDATAVKLLGVTGQGSTTKDNVVTWGNVVADPQDGRLEVGSSAVLTRVFRGAYDYFKGLLDKGTLKRGKTWDSTGIWTIDNLSLERLPGAGGRLTIRLVPVQYFTLGKDGNDGKPLNFWYTIEMSQVEKPLLSHPTLAANIDAMRAWNGETNLTLKKALQYTGAAGATATLPEGACQTFAKKILLGIESYLVFAPVVTKETDYDALPKNIGADCGKIKTPPYTAGGGFVFLKTADRCTQNQTDGTWHRSEQWTGADAWDTDIYAAS